VGVAVSQEVTFRVNLLHDGNTFQDSNTLLGVANTKTLYLPTGLGSVPVKKLKHNDQFVLSGLSAARLRRLIQGGFVLNVVEVIEAEEEVVSSDLQLIISSDRGDGLFWMSLGENSSSIGGHLHEFDSDHFDSEDFDDILLASDGEFIYVLYDQNDELKFTRIAANGTETYIDISDTIYDGRDHIDDGGDDLFDGGNYLNTNLNNNIPYVHSANASNGIITDGTTWFGSGSYYFTNNNDRVFSLVATNMSITSFSTSGGSGADGSGSVSSGRTVVSVGGHDFSVFYKQIYDVPSEPSLVHFMIIPGDQDLTHEPSMNTDEDIDVLSELDSTTRLAYLMFALNNDVSSTALDTGAIEDIAEAFITATNFRTAAIADIKTGLNSMDFPSLIEGIFELDDGTGLEVDLNAFTYIGDNKFAYLNDHTYNILNLDGEVEASHESDAYMSVFNFVMFENQLYGFGFSNIIYPINKATGVVEGEGDEEDKKSNILNWVEDSSETPSIEGINFGFVADNRLYAIGFEGGNEFIVEVFPETNTIRFVSWFATNDVYSIVQAPFDGDESDEIGYSTERYLRFHNYYYDNELWIKENQFSVTPTAENVILQWASDEEFIDNPETVTWHSVTITDIVYDDEDKEYTFSYTAEDLPGNGDYYLRARYENGEQWLYIRED